MQECDVAPERAPALGVPVGLAGWRERYAVGGMTPRALLHELLGGLNAEDPAWISLVTPEALDAQLAALDGADASKLPLYGVPFAIKDNIDAAGMVTTAACPEYGYVADEDATVVGRLKAAGAVLIGKTNLDQFATGLVGTRSPYGAVPNAFDPERISGGSSSGSAVVVARGVVPFSLGTDTAGSGRVPAGLNNLVGLKPTRGSVSTRGVVPACRSLDCVSVFALTVEDAFEVHEILRVEDPSDEYSRAADEDALAHRFPENPRFAVPANPRWYGDAQGEAAFEAALEKLRAMGAVIEAIDFSPMYEMAELLYGGPWVAERLAAVGEFMAAKPEAVHPVVRGIISKGENFDAVEAYRAEYRRAKLAKKIRAVFSSFDALLVPTAPTFPTIAEVNAAPVEANSRLGTYTNFVNLSDCSALALPAGFREDGLPFGVTLIADTWHDDALAEFGARWQAFAPWPAGATGNETSSSPGAPIIAGGATSVRLAVVGAHLTGMPLNHQLTERGSRFVEKTTTASDYRLYALPGTVPPKPGLVRGESGAAIEVELWDVPVRHFGSFVAAIPAPLGIGTLELADGRMVKGFICEGRAVESARDITSFGGWRAFIAASNR